MRVAVISDFVLGSPKAHAINVVKTAGGFQRLGCETTLYCRGPKAGMDLAPLLAQYGERDLRLVAAPPPWDDPDGGDYERRAASFADWVETRVETGVDLVYGRAFLPPLRLADRGFRAIMETHAYIDDPNPMLDRCFAATRRAANPLVGVSTISERLRAHYIERGADPARVRVVPDGVDLDLFAPPQSPPSPPYTRQPEAPHAVYAGHLYDYKGVPTVLKAARKLPHVHFDLVGGMPEDLAKTKRRVDYLKLDNVTLHGWQSHRAVPPFLWPAAALLLPPSMREPSANWTSPLKLGEYLAAGAPLICSRIPSLQDWVSEPATRWFAPDDAGDLARVIAAAAAETPDQARIRRAEAWRLAQRFSYANRARALLELAGLSPP